MNFYEKCTSLSKIGNERSLDELLTYCQNDNKNIQKTARACLKKTKNKKLLKRILDERIKNAAPDEKERSLLLGVRVLRTEYIYDYLAEIKRTGGDLRENGFLKSVKDLPLDAKEQNELSRYIVDFKDFDTRLISLIDNDKREEILYAILTYSAENGITADLTKVFQESKDYLDLIQPELRQAVYRRDDGASTFATYLDLRDVENQKCIDGFLKMSLIYSAVKSNVWKYSRSIFQVSFERIRIALKLVNQEEIDENDWNVIKASIAEEMLGIHDGKNATKMLFVFLTALAHYDYDYSEQTLITIHKRTHFYSFKALNILAQLHSEFAYRELLKIVIMAEEKQECFNTCVKLISSYPDRVNSIIEYIKILDDDKLLQVIQEKARRIRPNEIYDHDNSMKELVSGNTKCTIIDHKVLISELLVKISEEIDPDCFCAAVGFTFSSGMRLLNPVLEKVHNNSGRIELIIGALENYGTGLKNGKIDRNTVTSLDQLRHKFGITLYTYPDTFYHGKYYYIGNRNKAYVIIGSSNISKTAYLNNYELDLLIEIDNTNAEDKKYYNWYENFKKECISIGEFDYDLFDTLKWESELDAFTPSSINRLSDDEVKDRISELSDEDTKFRLNTWLEYKPAEVFSNLGIQSLQDYIVFLFPTNGLAVFESFIPGNAYYAFMYNDFERLLNQVSALTKTQMLMNSAFINRGYHLQDKQRTKEKIAFLFAEKM